MWWLGLAVTHRIHTNPQLACVRSLCRNDHCFLEQMQRLCASSGQFLWFLCNGANPVASHEQIHDLADEKACRIGRIFTFSGKHLQDNGRKPPVVLNECKEHRVRSFQGRKIDFVPTTEGVVHRLWVSRNGGLDNGNEFG